MNFKHYAPGTQSRPFGASPQASGGGFGTFFCGKRSSYDAGFSFSSTSATASETNSIIEAKTPLVPVISGIFSCSSASAGPVCQNKSKETVSKPPKIFRRTKVFKDLKQLFLKQEDCDIVIKVKEQEFKAHRTILAARSPVFGSIFRNNMKEKETGILDIEDCDPSSFTDFLHFLYCGEIETLSKENVFSLFATADKYDVQDLREMCLEFMKENIAIDTFCDTITFALLHSESELITLATDFFVKNARKIVKTVPWQTFLDSNTTQGNELIIKALDAAADPNE